MRPTETPKEKYDASRVHCLFFSVSTLARKVGWFWAKNESGMSMLGSLTGSLDNEFCFHQKCLRAGCTVSLFERKRLWCIGTCEGSAVWSWWVGRICLTSVVALTSVFGATYRWLVPLKRCENTPYRVRQPQAGSTDVGKYFLPRQRRKVGWHAQFCSAGHSRRYYISICISDMHMVSCNGVITSPRWRCIIRVH